VSSSAPDSQRAGRKGCLGGAQADRGGPFAAQGPGGGRGLYHGGSVRRCHGKEDRYPRGGEEGRQEGPQARQVPAEVPQPREQGRNLDRPRQAAALAGGAGRQGQEGRGLPDQEVIRAPAPQDMETPARAGVSIYRFLRAGTIRLPNSSPAISARMMFTTAIIASCPTATSCCWLRVISPRRLALPGTSMMIPGTRTIAPGRLAHCA